MGRKSFKLFRFLVLGMLVVVEVACKRDIPIPVTQSLLDKVTNSIWMWKYESRELKDDGLEEGTPYYRVLYFPTRSTAILGICGSDGVIIRHISTYTCEEISSTRLLLKAPHRTYGEYWDYNEREHSLWGRGDKYYPQPSRHITIREK